MANASGWLLSLLNLQLMGSQLTIMQAGIERLNVRAEHPLDISQVDEASRNVVSVCEHPSGHCSR